MDEFVSLRVLILEDQPAKAELLVDTLRQAAFEPEWWRVDHEADYLTCLDPAPDIILADDSLLHWDTLRALRALQERGLAIPFIILSETLDEELAVSALKQGAADYLVKDRLARLGLAVTKALEETRLRLEKQQAVAALRESEIRYRRLFEAAQDGILILDAETGMILDVNAFLIDLLGYSHLEFLGKKLWEIGVFRDIAASEAAFKHLVETGYIRYKDLPLETNHGRSIAVEFVSNVYQASGKTFVLCNVRDLTERNRADEAIRSLAKFPEEDPQPVLRLGNDGVILYSNQMGQSLLADLGRAVGEAVPAPWRDLVTRALARPSGATMDFPHRDKIWSLVAVPILGEAYMNIYGMDITERKQAEENLSRERSLLQTVIDNIPDLIYAKDVEGRFLFRNASSLRLVGVNSADEVVGKTDFDFYPPELAERYNSDDSQVIHSGQPLINREEMTIDLDGNIRWLLTTKVPPLDSLGNATGVIGISRDVTERKRAEDELRKLYRAVEQSASMIYITDLQGNIEYVNRSFTQITGYTLEDIIGKNMQILQSDQTWQEVYTELWAIILAGGEWHGEFLNRKRSGELFWVAASISAIKDASGQNTNFLAVNEDITERKRAEEAIRFQARLLERVAQAVIATSIDGKVIYWNRFAQTLYGWSSEEVIGRNIVDLIPADISREQAAEIMARLQSGETWSGEFTVRNKDGTTFPALMIDSPFADEQGTLIGIIGVSMDITVRKQSEEAIRALNTDLERRVAERTMQFVTANQQAEAILNSSHDPVILCRTDGTINQAN